MQLACSDGPMVEPGDPEEAAARVLEALALALERTVSRNQRLAPDREEETEEEEEEEVVVVGVSAEERAASAAERRRRRGLAVFEGPRAPRISVGKYLERLRRFTGCSAACFVVGFVYIDRAAHRHPGSLVVALNVHRLVLTSLLIASKVLDDAHHSNAFFAKVGGVSNAELNRLELELLFLLDFGLVVTERVYERYCSHLENEKMIMARRAGTGIGFSKWDDDYDGDGRQSNNGRMQGLSNGRSLRPHPSSPRRSIDW